MIRNFDAITLDHGRKLLKDARFLILLEWDIANAMIFDAVRREEKKSIKLRRKPYKTIKG